VRHSRQSDSRAAILLLVVAAGAGLAQAQTNIQKSAAIAGRVMSGQRKADAPSLQLLLLMDEDASEGNPVAIALHREVLGNGPRHIWIMNNGSG